MIQKKIAVIGSDSFIAGKFIHSASLQNESLKLFGRRPIGFSGEKILDDFFELNSKDFEQTDTLINFAAIVHQPKNTDAVLYDKINTRLPQFLAEQAKKAGVKHFVQLSTIAVYGNTQNIQANSPENPLTIYGKSKLAADRALLAMQTDDFKVSVIRPPMVYGGGNAPGNLMRLIRFALKGIPMPFKDIENARDFIHVQNLTEALSIVCEHELSGVLIPSDKKPVSTEEIIRCVKNHAVQKVRIVSIPKLFLRVAKKMLPSYYEKLFGTLHLNCNLPEDLYKPKYTLNQGVLEMLRSIKKQ